jgi:hypothetical protein
VAGILQCPKPERKLLKGTRDDLFRQVQSVGRPVEKSSPPQLVEGKVSLTSAHLGEFAIRMSQWSRVDNCAPINNLRHESTSLSSCHGANIAKKSRIR